MPGWAFFRLDTCKCSPVLAIVWVLADMLSTRDKDDQRETILVIVQLTRHRQNESSFGRAILPIGRSQRVISWEIHSLGKAMVIVISRSFLAEPLPVICFSLLTRTRSGRFVKTCRREISGECRSPGVFPAAPFRRGTAFTHYFDSRSVYDSPCHQIISSNGVNQKMRQ